MSHTITKPFMTDNGGHRKAMCGYDPKHCEDHVARRPENLGLYQDCVNFAFLDCCCWALCFPRDARHDRFSPRHNRCRRSSRGVDSRRDESLVRIDATRTTNHESPKRSKARKVGLLSLSKRSAASKLRCPARNLLGFSLLSDFRDSFDVLRDADDGPAGNAVCAVNA